MKILTLAVICLALVFSPAFSCNRICGCKQQCNIFNNGSLKVCRTSYRDGLTFLLATDSLKTLYGQYTTQYLDSITVSGSSDNAINQITNQLELQGYSCDCSN